MLRQKIKQLVEEEVGRTVAVEASTSPVFGDYTTNVAMLLKQDPQEIVTKIKDSPLIEKIEVKNGFINFFIRAEYLQTQVKEILKQKTKFANLDIGKGKKVNVEFISANPTGPLTLGNGRGGFTGDVLAKVLVKAGFRVTREYYVNDTGAQIKQLGHSVLGDAEAGYQGAYIEELRKKIKRKEAAKVGEQAAKYILDRMVKPSIKKMGIKFDVWFSEKSLYQKKEITKVLAYLKKKDLVYEKEGALWFKSSQFADDKDRVLIKQDGETTYFLSDIAYLKNKLERGFDKLFIFLGADHYGYVGRMQAAMSALGEDQELAIIIMQLVRLMQQGQEVRMSKRKGVYVTLDELLDEIGLDVARFFFLTKAANSHLNFDLDLAKEQSDKNPVYYIQYAYARIASILKKLKIKENIKVKDVSLLNHPSELNLIKNLVRFPEIVHDIVIDQQVQRLPQYALSLATAFHLFYRDCRVINEDKDLERARRALLLASKIVLKETLGLMGIAAPESM